MDKALVKITCPDGSVYYMKGGGIVVSDKEYAKEYPLGTAKWIVAQPYSILGEDERYEVEMIK